MYSLFRRFPYKEYFGKGKKLRKSYVRAGVERKSYFHNLIRTYYLNFAFTLLHDASFDFLFTSSGYKLQEANALQSKPRVTILRKLPKSVGEQRYGLKEDFVESINNHQTHWRAGVYPQFENKTIAEMVNMAGGLRHVPSTVRPR